jgi:5-methylcytosine-specific restriction endonuclease McrA
MKKEYQYIADTQLWCQLCGSTNNLHIHHIIYRSQLGKTHRFNLIRLCNDCHNLVHSNKAKYKPILIDLQKQKYEDFDERLMK